MHDKNLGKGAAIRSAQKYIEGKNIFNLPFGIHNHYYQLSKKIPFKKRYIDFCHINGSGIYSLSLN